MWYLQVEQVQLVQPASAPGGVFAAGQRHRVVVAVVPGSADPAGVIVHTAAIQLHTNRKFNCWYVKWQQGGKISGEKKSLV